jgi:hypothetical protein
VRLSDLLGAEVVDDRGRSAGRVHDLRLEQAMPGARFQLDGLVVGRRALGARFGFDRGTTRGPWLLKVVFGWAGHDGRYVSWDRVRSVEHHRSGASGAHGQVGGDDPFAEFDVAQRVRDGRQRLPPGRHGLVEREQLQLERVLVGDELVAVP